jgi:hypothetical protein
VTGGAADDVADAYVWAYPLLEVHRQWAASGRTGLHANGALADDRDRSVVAPNNDTLYASGFFDLLAGDVTIDVAPMDRPDRYWSVMLLDAYTHVSYVCRRLHGSQGVTVEVTHDPSGRAAAPGVVALGTPTVWVLVRVLVLDMDDLPAARQAMAGIRVCQALAGPPRSPVPVPASGSGAALLEAIGRALASDPPAPWHPAPPARLAAVLDGRLAPEVVSTGIRQGRHRILAHGPGADRAGNGWTTRHRGAAFGDDPLYRAAFARYSLAGHLPEESRSYATVVDGAASWQLHFPAGGEPPVDAFWSLTAYGTDLFLVDNRLGRHSIGDRTAGLRRAAGGALTLDIGQRPPADPSNWLPTPGGPCVLVLRAYEGHPPVTDATWFPPELTPAGEPR